MVFAMSLIIGDVYSDDVKEMEDKTNYTSAQLAVIKEYNDCSEKYGDNWPVAETYRIDVLLYTVGLIGDITSGIPDKNELTQDDALSIAYKEMANAFNLSDDLSVLQVRYEFHAVDFNREWHVYFYGFTSGELDNNELISVRLDAATGECLGIYTNADGVG